MRIESNGDGARAVSPEFFPRRMDRALAIRNRETVLRYVPDARFLKETL